MTAPGAGMSELSELIAAMESTVREQAGAASEVRVEVAISVKKTALTADPPAATAPAPAPATADPASTAPATAPDPAATSVATAPATAPVPETAPATTALLATAARPALGVAFPQDAATVVPGKPFYVIFSCPRKDLIGIHHCQWRDLCDNWAPGVNPIYQARDCKKFDNLTSAVEYFNRRTGTAEHAPKVICY